MAYPVECHSTLKEIFSETGYSSEDYIPDLLAKLKSTNLTDRNDTHLEVRKFLKYIRDHSRKSEILEYFHHVLTKHSYDIDALALLQLLTLMRGKSDDWLSFLKADFSSTNGNDHYLLDFSGYPASLLEDIDDDVRAHLIKEVSKLYKVKRYKRGASLALHHLLKPYEMYKDVIEKGKGLFDFYKLYINRVLTEVFGKSPKTAQEYNELILPVLKSFQEYQKKRVKKSGSERDLLVFFGSVPNGFARPTSDFDLFNFPQREKYPELEEKIKVAESSMGRFPHPLEHYRYQVTDSELQSKLDSITSKTLAKGWHLEDKGEHAHEHFGAVTHIFTFVISKNSIKLRFYPNFKMRDFKVTETNDREEFIEVEIEN